ncbi:hypothetical protein KAJ26_06050, partial [bacterium]|nr:hypothetical protein [bacterium]
MKRAIITIFFLPLVLLFASDPFLLELEIGILGHSANISLSNKYSTFSNAGALDDPNSKELFSVYYDFETHFSDNLIHQAVIHFSPGDLGTFALTARHLTLQNISTYDGFGMPTGSIFDVYYDMIGLAYSKSIKELFSFGFKLNYLSDRFYDYTASAVFADLGIKWKLSNYQMGITVRNLELYQDSEVSYSESLKFGFGISRQFGIHDAWLLTTSLDLGYDRGPFYVKLSLFALLWDTLNFRISTHISRHYNGYDVLS